MAGGPFTLTAAASPALCGASSVELLRGAAPGQPAFFFDCLECRRGTPGEHDPDRVLALVLGEGCEKHIDRRALAIGGSGAP
jgi:hypothetical protein